MIIRVINFVGITNSSDVFTNLLHEFFPAWAVEKENKLLIGPKIVFSQFQSWKRNHNKSSLKRFVDFEFEIGENKWWIS